MADQTTPQSDAPSAETTLAKDQDLAVNQPASGTPPTPSPAAASTPVNFSPPVASSTPASAPTPELITAPESSSAAPITISKQEAVAAEPPASAPVTPPAPAEPKAPVEQLHADIGSLPTKTDAAKADPIVQPPKMADKPTMPPADKPAAKAADKSTAVPVTAATPDKSAVATFRDIFPKTAIDAKQAQAAAAEESALTNKPEKISPLLVIGEVLGTFGIIAVAVLLASPFYQSLLLTSWFNNLTAVGWLVAPASLLIGFILTLFGKHHWLFKILLLILCIGSFAFYWALYQNGALANSLTSLLGSIISFYR